MVTYRVFHPVATTAEPLTKGLTVCDPGDAMTGMGFLTSGEARSNVPGSSGEPAEGSECTAEIPEDPKSIPEGGLPLCPLVGYVTCVDLPPFQGESVPADGETVPANGETGPADSEFRHESIQLRPQIGPTGYTTTVEGSGFAAGTQVGLRWDRGIDTRGIAVTVMEDGGFTAQRLVLPNDLSVPGR